MYFTARDLKDIKKGGDLFLIEGRFADEIPREYVVRIVVSDSYMKKHPDAAFGAPVQTVGDAVFNQISDTKTPQGVMAVCRKRMLTADDALRGVVRLCVLAEGVNDPGNLGTIIRTARACGANAVFLSAGCADIYNPKVVRAAAGSLYRVPVVSGDLLHIAAALKGKDVKIIAARAGGDVYPFDIDMSGKSAVMIGNETHGLSDALIQAADHVAAIPMPGGSESLNASIACAVLLYEAVRQGMAR